MCLRNGGEESICTSMGRSNCSVGMTAKFVLFIVLLRWLNEVEEMCSAYFKNDIAYKILLGKDS